ncbi:unnamed protein product [Diatraea saccharalis]|uniref:ARHGEF1-like PH domain-containing protein n=1 Tax=Diatraea saccharalis TaxID=40085 RepID=A0A9N9R5Z5_9NEOP|nr:unnamed protein product [Diatraea saccharalis]
MLLSVDQAIRATENEHRLRNIQAKLEVRAGNEWDELRRLELPSRRLRLEGELTLRLDQHKKTAVLALMFEDMLVLLQKEGDKFLLKPLPHQHGLLSPLIKWDKVLFRPNAAVRNTFFLMNINGVQMHELSANTAAEYATWVNCIQEAPLAKVELKQTITPSHQPTRSTDDEGTTNVSRNPSDASEKSIATTDEPESDKDRTPGPPECERESTPAEERDEKPELDVKEKEETLDKEEKLMWVLEFNHWNNFYIFYRLDRHNINMHSNQIRKESGKLQLHGLAVRLVLTAKRTNSFTLHDSTRLYLALLKYFL